MIILQVYLKELRERWCVQFTMHLVFKRLSKQKVIHRVATPVFARSYSHTLKEATLDTVGLTMHCLKSVGLIGNTLRAQNEQ
jgi:hypothetical protein